MTTGIKKLGTNHYNIRVRATCPRTGREREVERVRKCTLAEARSLQSQWLDDLTEKLNATGSERARQRLRDFVPSWMRGRLEAGELKPLAPMPIG